MSQHPDRDHHGHSGDERPDQRLAPSRLVECPPLQRFGWAWLLHAMRTVAGLTFGSGVVAAMRMTETGGTAPMPNQ